MFRLFFFYVALSYMGLRAGFSPFLLFPRTRVCFGFLPLSFSFSFSFLLLYAFCSYTLYYKPCIYVAGRSISSILPLLLWSVVRVVMGFF